MAYVEIKDFKNGLDTRRPAIVGEAGSLREASNVHISRGGDIENCYFFSPDIALPAGTLGMHGANDKLVVFGAGAAPVNLPGEVIYQQLISPAAAPTIAILAADNYDGKVYVIAEFADGNIFHYYDTERVIDWDAEAATIADNSAVTTYLTDKLDALPSFLASSTALEILITAAVPGVGFTVAQATTGSGTLSITTIQGNQAAVAEVRATSSFTVTGGFPEADNYLTILVANGSDDLAPSPVYYILNNDATALAIATAVNNGTETHGYTASSAGPTVTISAPVGLGAAANGYTLNVVSHGLMTTTGAPDFSGGVSAVAAKPQIVKIEVGGTYADANTYRITLNGVDTLITGLSSGYGRVIRTFRTKMYAGIRALMAFSAVDDPEAWTSGTGTGLLNISSQNSGSQRLTGIGVYQENLALFSRNTIQIWSIDLDPDNNVYKKTLPNTGTRSPDALLPINDSDLLYISESGIRSLRARDINGAAYVDDIGTKIDTHVIAFLKTVSDPELIGASAIVDPLDSRAWVAIKNRIYVFSYFPGSKVSAWTYYEPGFSIQHMAVANRRVYLRSGDTIYRYGGVSGDAYPTAGQMTARVRLPFIDAGRIAGGKKVTGVDIICSGEWDVRLLLDPRNEALTTEVLGVSGPTTLLGRIMITADTTHFAPLLISDHGGPLTFSEVVVHFDDTETD